MRSLSLLSTRATRLGGSGRDPRSIWASTSGVVLSASLRDIVSRDSTRARPGTWLRMIASRTAIRASFSWSSATSSATLSRQLQAPIMELTWDQRHSLCRVARTWSTWAVSCRTGGVSGAVIRCSLCACAVDMSGMLEALKWCRRHRPCLPRAAVQTLAAMERAMSSKLILGVCCGVGNAGQLLDRTPSRQRDWAYDILKAERLATWFWSLFGQFTPDACKQAPACWIHSLR